jgi:hypothetical protein
VKTLFTYQQNTVGGTVVCIANLLEFPVRCLNRKLLNMFGCWVLLFHHQIKISYSRLLIPGELRFSFLIGIGFIPCGLKYLGRPISNSDMCVCFMVSLPIPHIWRQNSVHVGKQNILQKEGHGNSNLLKLKGKEKKKKLSMTHHFVLR